MKSPYRESCSLPPEPPRRPIPLTAILFAWTSLWIWPTSWALRVMNHRGYGPLPKKG